MAENIRFLFNRNQYIKPQVMLARTTPVRMWALNLCALTVIVQSSIGDSFSSLAVAAGAVTAAVITEFLFLIKKDWASGLKDGTAVSTALILSLLLPNGISPFYAAAGAAFAIAVIKHSFGGLGANWLNPALGGWLFVRFSWSSSFYKALEGSYFSLLERGIDPFAGAASSGNAAGDLLNRTIFSLTGAQMPEGYMNLFSSPYPGIIADRGVLALLLGTIILFAFRACRPWVPFLYLAVFGFLFRVFGALPYSGVFWEGDVLFAICSGGTLTAAFFLAAEPVSGVKTKPGIFITVILGGTAAFLFRTIGGEPYGAIYAVLFVNLITPLIRLLESLDLYKKLLIMRKGGKNQ